MCVCVCVLFVIIIMTTILTPNRFSRNKKDCYTYFIQTYVLYDDNCFNQCGVCELKFNIFLLTAVPLFKPT